MRQNTKIVVASSGANTTTTVKIGDTLTLKGAITASGAAETIEIGRDWQIDGTLSLGDGNDRLRIGTTTRDSAGTISGGAGTDTLELVLTADQQVSFASAASAARWVQAADGSWDTQGRALSWQGESFTAFEIVKTILADGASAVPVKTAIDTLQTWAGNDSFILGPDTTLKNGADFGGGANGLTAGDNFTLQAGNLVFDASAGGADLSLGKNANLNGGDIYMNAAGVANAVSIGDGSKISYVAMNGGGANASQTLLIGDKVVSDYAIAMNGSGTAADAMELSLSIGSGSSIGGAVNANGNYATKVVSIGDGVTINGALSLQGTNDTTSVLIGDNLTLKGAYTGAASADAVEIGKEWQIDGTVDLGGGDDRLRIGTTTRDTAGTISGGAGTDTLEVVVTSAQKTTFDAAAKSAGWSQAADGSWNTQGKAITWQGNTFTNFEVAKTLIEGTAAAKTAMTGIKVLGTAGDDFIVGTSRDDVLQGGAGNDRFVAGKGNDTIDGGAGRDVVEVAGKITDYSFSKDAAGALHMIHATDGHDILQNIEAVFFHASGETVTVDHLPG